MNGRRLGVVLVLVLVGLVGGAGAASADPAPVPPWPTVGGMGLATTGWNGTPISRWEADPMAGSLRTVGVSLGEPLWDAALGYVQVPYLRLVNDTTRPASSPGLQLVLTAVPICQNTTTLALTEVSPGQSTSTSYGGTAAISLISQTKQGVLQVGCVAAGTVPYGVAFYASWMYGTLTTATWRNTWFVDEALPNPGLGPVTCREIFGVDYTAETTAVVEGVTVTAGPYGCPGDYFTDPGGGTDPVAQAAEDEATSFALLCADAPAAEWLSFAWIGPWVGHYATCLFEPVGWDVGGRIDSAYAASPIGPVSGAIAGLNQVQLTGQCGVLGAGTIYGNPLSVNTCTWPVWPVPRYIIGLGALIAAGFAVLSMLVGALGLDFGVPMLQRTLYTGE